MLLISLVEALKVCSTYWTWIETIKPVCLVAPVLIYCSKPVGTRTFISVFFPVWLSFDPTPNPEDLCISSYCFSVKLLNFTLFQIRCLTCRFLGAIPPVAVLKHLARVMSVHLSFSTTFWKLNMRCSKLTWLMWSDWQAWSAHMFTYCPLSQAYKYVCVMCPE